MTYTGAVLDVLVAGTASFIAAAPATITLKKYDTVSDGTGGRRVQFVGNRAPQTVTLVEPGSSGYQWKTTIAQGTNTLVDFLLVGMPDLEIGLNDQFTYNGVEYKIENLMPFNGYERRAMVVRTSGQ